MNERRDLGFTLVGATVLMLSLVYLTQCSSGTHPSESANQGIAASHSATPTTSAVRQREAAEREDDEESVRVKSIGHAIQTIGADPVLSKTYGVDGGNPSSDPHP